MRRESFRIGLLDFSQYGLVTVIFRTLLEMLGRVKKVKLSDATFVFVNKAKIWNREVFGNVFAKKKRLMARLGGSRELWPIALATSFSIFKVSFLMSITISYNWRKSSRQ